jgi:hypothetical protein
MRIGKSYYQSRDFKKEGILFSPISVFGIGILSCFMMADRIEVETLKEGREPRKVEIENYSEYFVTRRGSRTETGTTITLFLKDDAELDVIEELKKYARHVKFPVYVDDGENAETIVDQGYDFNFVDYMMDPLYKQYTDELNPYVINFEEEDIEGVKGKLVFMFLKDENGSYGFKSRNLPLDGSLFEKSWQILQPERGLLSQDGILIKKNIPYEAPIKKILPLWMGGGSIFCDVNLEDGSKIDLSIDRNDVVTNDKLNNLRTKIAKIIIEHIGRIFSQKHLVTSKDKNRFMERFFSVFCDRFTHIPDFFLERMNELLIFECYVNGKLKYRTYNELKNHWKYFYYFIDEEVTSEDLKKALEKAYPEDLIIYDAPPKTLPDLLRKFGGDLVIVTNKELGHSVEKYLLIPSAGIKKNMSFSSTSCQKYEFSHLT